ncbi:hypothetical protein [Planctopirus hydrillae]|uniref:Uncharacterized protein n=1 Tax=Planctopirus hydrillae TaxID=1841610 RepID=A0A1C3E766_9PLAN|nr:hypothetical protein [Planctopirus hydrillae]ODA29090.1 hypothetical protein A6X21_09755 [Planctopirus hydrillae]
MAKSLLILMLMTTQLLAGSGGSVYLCICNDGSCTCFDAGPDLCTCCHDEHKEGVRHCCGGCEKDGDRAPCSHHDEEQPVCPDDIFVAGDPCGCTHIPVVMSSDQPTNVVRPSRSVEGERLFSLIALLPMLAFDHYAVAHPPLRWADPPVVPDFALTVVSTVVIRC